MTEEHIPIDLPERMTFAEHRDRTVQDLESVIEQLQTLKGQVQEGDIQAFERWWYEGGTEEGDATVFKIRQMLLIRYVWRADLVRTSTKVGEPDVPAT